MVHALDFNLVVCVAVCMLCVCACMCVLCVKEHHTVRQSRELFNVTNEQVGVLKDS